MTFTTSAAPSAAPGSGGVRKAGVLLLSPTGLLASIPHAMSMTVDHHAMRNSPSQRVRYGHTAALALAISLTGCTAKPPSAELFPLEPGHHWIYSQQTEMENGRSDSRWLQISALPPEDFDGVRAWRRSSDDGAEYWLRRDETGIFRIASRNELEDEPQKDPLPRYVLKEPLALGTEWQAQTVPYLLERRQGGFPPELRHEGKPVMMRYSIDALNESVQVPAGRFEGCLRVHGHATLKLYVDPVTGWRDMPLTTLEWYCPGPGLVKLARQEPAGSHFLLGGSVTLELQSWEAP